MTGMVPPQWVNVRFRLFCISLVVLVSPPATPALQPFVQYNLFYIMSPQCLLHPGVPFRCFKSRIPISRHICQFLSQTLKFVELPLRSINHRTGHRLSDGSCRHRLVFASCVLPEDDRELALSAVPQILLLHLGCLSWRSSAHSIALTHLVGTIPMSSPFPTRPHHHQSSPKYNRSLIRTLRIRDQL
jgi:hypothetical protein